VLPSGFSHPVISYIFNKFRREVLFSLIIYHKDGGSIFLRIVFLLRTRLQNVATHFLSDFTKLHGIYEGDLSAVSISC